MVVERETGDGDTEMELCKRQLELAFDNEEDALNLFLQKQICLLEQRGTDVRLHALCAIDAYLGPTTRVDTRNTIKDILEWQLWREDDSTVAQKLVKLLASLAVIDCSKHDCTSYVSHGMKSNSVVGSSLPMLNHTSNVSMGLQFLCGKGKFNKKNNLAAVVLHENKDGEQRGSGNYSPQLVTSVAWTLQQYLGKKRPLKAGVRAQILQSLLSIGEKTRGIVSWDILGPAVREQLGSSSPQLRVLTMQLLVVSIQEKDTVRSSISPAVSTDSKKRRISNGIATHLLVPQTVKKITETETRAEDKPGSDDPQGVIEIPGLETLGLKDPGQVAGEYLQHVLLEYTGDSYPSVREAALKALVRLHGKGYDLNDECYKQGIGLFQDFFEPVRIAAIQLVSAWMMMRQNFGDEMSSNQANEAFLQVCTKVTDMNMKVRQETFYALGGMTSIGERVLLQTLSKKLCGTDSKDNGNLSNASVITPESDTDLVKFEEGANLLHASAAGAFVHGLEDEFSEVRTVAMEALAKLACGCEKMVPGAADLLLDMLNDEAMSVRMQAVHALSRVARTGHLSVLDNHLHMFLSVLEDTNTEMRQAGHSLLASVHLPTFATFQATVRALLSSLEHYHKDEESVTLALGHLGQINPTYTERITDELLQEIQILLNGDSGFDEPRCPAILVLFLAAAMSNATILSLLPPKLLSYARLIHHKLPNSLPILDIWPAGSKTVQFGWLTRKKTGDMNTGVTAYDTLLSQSTGSEQKGNMGTELLAPNNFLPDDGLLESSVSVSPVFRESIIPPQSYYPRNEEHNRLCQEGEKEVLDCITNIIQAAHSVHKILERKAVKKALLVLRRDLKRLQIQSETHSAIMRFSALYIQCLTLIAQIQACPSPFRIRTLRLKSESVEHLSHKLEQIVRRMGSCFLGLNLKQRRQLLEFRALVCLLRISYFPVNPTHIDADISLYITHLSSILLEAQGIMEHHNLSLSPFLRTVQVEFLQGDLKSCSTGVQKIAQQLGASYWPTNAVVNSNLRETWAEMMAPGSDFEQPIGFISGLPLGIPVVIMVHNAPEGAHFWVQYRLENLLPKLRYLDLFEAASSGKDLSWTAVLQVDEMPSVVSCALKICVMLEADKQESEKRSHIRGPRGPMVPLCVEGAVHLVLNKEKGAKTSQQRQ